MNILKVVAVTTSLILSTSVNAAFINGSFEDVHLQSFPNAVTPILPEDSIVDGWYVTSGSVELIVNDYWQSSEGLYSIDVSGYTSGTINQTFNTIVGQTYKVLFDLAGNPEGPASVMSLQVSAAANSAVYTFNTTGHSNLEMGWTEQFFLFQAQDVISTLSFSSLNADSYGPALDNVRVNAVPIPAAVWLFGSGLIGLIGFARKRK